MSQKVIVVGNSLAVTIPKDSAKKLGLRSGSRVEVRVDTKRRMLSFSPIASLRAEGVRVAELTAKFMRRYDKDLRNLADR